MAHHNEIEKELLDYLRGRVPNEERANLTPATPLAETGVLDSLGFMEFVGFIQDRFSITLQDHDYVPENLSTVAGCTRMIADRRTTP